MVSYLVTMALGYQVVSYHLLSRYHHFIYAYCMRWRGATSIAGNVIYDDICYLTSAGNRTMQLPICILQLYHILYTEVKDNMQSVINS